MKKLMILGGSSFALPVIKAAHDLGLYVITADYLPDNTAHKYSDQYCNVSTVDFDAVLRAAQKNIIDGIMSFACDSGVVTAAYVAEQLGLPSAGSYESVSILQNKGRFRKFLSDHGFNVPTAKGYNDAAAALNDVDLFHWPVIVKPTDSAGSKGVSRVDTPAGLKKAIDNAVAYSQVNEFIVEDFIEKKGCSTDSDCFSVNGKLVFVSYSSQRFDENALNPYTPAAFSWPSTMTKEQEEYLTAELQRLISLLNLQTSIYNVEARVGMDDKVYIMEVSPRGGGNRLAEMVRFATGEDMIKAAVIGALGGVPDIKQKDYQGCWAEIILHSISSGRFSALKISDKIKPYVQEIDLWKEKGEDIQSFQSARQTVGTLVLKFPNETILNDCMNNVSDLYKVEVI